MCESTHYHKAGYGKQINEMPISCQNKCDELAKVPVIMASCLKLGVLFKASSM